MLLIVVLAVWLTPMREHFEFRFDPGMVMLASGGLTIGLLIFYRRLSRWMGVLIASFVIHPVWMMIRPFETIPSLAALDPEHSFDFLARTLIIQGMFVLGLFLTLRDLAHRLTLALPTQPTTPDRPDELTHEAQPDETRNDCRTHPTRSY